MSVFRTTTTTAMNNHSTPVHLPLYTPSGSLPSIRSRTPEEVQLGERMLREFYAPYKRLVLPEEQERESV